MNSPPVNPYSAPAVEEIPAPAPAEGTSGGYYRDGSRLYFRPDTTLPGICPFSGRIAKEKWELQEQSVTWTPLWTLCPLGMYLLILLPRDILGAPVDQTFENLLLPIVCGLLSLVPLRLTLQLRSKYQKSALVRIKINPSVQRSNHLMLVLTVILAAVSCLLLLLPIFSHWIPIDAPPKLLLIGGALLLPVAFLPLFSIQRFRGIRYHGDWFSTAGCDPDFLKHLPAWRSAPLSTAVAPAVEP